MKFPLHRVRFVHYLKSEIIQILEHKNEIIVVRQNEIETKNEIIKIPNIQKVLIGDKMIIGSLNGLYYGKDLIISNSVWSMAISGNILAVGCEDCIRLFKITSTLEYMTSYPFPRVLSMAFSRHFLLFSHQAIVKIINVDTTHVVNELVLDNFEGDTIIWELLVMEDMVVTADSQGKVQFWSIKTATLIKSLKCHDADVLCLAQLDGIVYSSGVDRKINRISLMKGEYQVTGSKKYHSHDVKAILPRPKPYDCLMTGGVDTSVVVAGPLSDFDKMKLDRGGYVPKNALSYSSEKRLLACHFDEEIRIWKLSDFRHEDAALYDGQQLEHDGFSLSLKFKLKGYALLCSSLNDAGNFLACGDANKSFIFTIEKSIQKYPLDFGCQLVCFAGHIAVFASNSTVIGYDIDDGIIWKHNVHQSRIQAICASPDGQYVVSSSDDRRTVLFDTISRKAVALPRFNGVVTAIAFLNATHIVLLTRKNGIYIWDIENNGLNLWSKKNSHDLPSRLVNGEELFGIFIADENVLVYGLNSCWKIEFKTKGRSVITELGRFKSIMSILGKDEIVVVERPILSLLADLPEAYKKKKYAT